jgi:predicted nucleic acid-binding protein
LRLENKAIDLFKECLTADLAYYEIRNFLLNTKRIDLAKDFLKVMRFLNIENVDLNEEVMTIAINENLTYYDAVFLFLSKKYKIPIVSDDNDLMNKGAIRSSEIIKGL